MPAVSVIIPTYNRANFIAETIQNVLEQSFRDFEIIVVDDGSTDNTQQIVSSFPVKYIRQENQGAPNARNTGIRTAKGQYIAVLDSDDCLYPGSLKKRFDVLEQYPEVALVYGQICTMDEHSQETGFKYPLWSQSCFRPHLDEVHDLLYNNHIPTSTAMIRKSSLDKVGLFNSKFIHGQEDLELWMRLVAQFDSFYIAEPLVKLRIHEQRLTNHLGIGYIENDHKQIIDSILNSPDLGPIFQPERKKIYAHLNHFMAEVAYTRRAMRMMRNYILRAIKLYPQGLLSRNGIRWLTLLVVASVPTFMLNIIRADKHYQHNTNKSGLQAHT